MKQALLILLFFGFGSLLAQQVINSAGSTRTSTNGISITDNVGEPFTETLGPFSNVMITQGYLQPSLYIAPGFSVSILKDNLSCENRKDGSIKLKIESGYTNYSAAYFWTPAVICPQNNCASVSDLEPGTYSVEIRITYTSSAGVVKQDTSFQSATVSDSNQPCSITIPTGVTPNGDGINDTWVIGNINSYSSNKVSIFNRWGQEVYTVDSYDNNLKVWKPGDEKLPSSTYFYVIDLKDGSKPYKGWVEVIKN